MYRVRGIVLVLVSANPDLAWRHFTSLPTYDLFQVRVTVFKSSDITKYLKLALSLLSSPVVKAELDCILCHELSKKEKKSDAIVFLLVPQGGLGGKVRPRKVVRSHIASDFTNTYNC